MLASTCRTGALRVEGIVWGGFARRVEQGPKSRSRLAVVTELTRRFEPMSVEFSIRDSKRRQKCSRAEQSRFDVAHGEFDLRMVVYRKGEVISLGLSVTSFSEDA